MSEIKTTQVEFTGKASEYFGIWIVNLLLSILTLGIYSAWAKVRRKKYFNNNTLIDNVGFDYHAKPTAILKGRIIAFIFFLAYAFGGQFNFFIPLVVGVIFLLALPWLVIRSSMFNARNTSHRGLRFDFVGKAGEAARVFIALPIASMFTMYLAWPYANHQINKYLVSNHKFGLSAFDLKAKVGSFYKIYAIVFIIPLIGILAAIIVPAYKSYVDNKSKVSQVDMPHAAAFAKVGTTNNVMLAANELEEEPYRVERVYSEPEGVEETIDNQAASEDEDAHGDESETDSANNKATTVEEKTFEEIYAESKKQQEQERNEMIKDAISSPAKALYALGFLLAYLIIIFAFAAYFKSRIGNLVWNNVTVDNLSFKSTLRARDYLWIYVTNIIAIALTFGLATPWAQVRLAKYRASKLQIVGDVDFDQFVGDKKDEVKATGEEIADFFDVDFSFG